MTIPVLRGLTEETANLPNLGKSLADLLSGGNSELQRKLREAIAQDPSVAENLAQLSRDNPQLFGALKLGKFGDKIAKTPEGFKQKREAQTLESGALANKQAGLNVQQTQNELDLNPVRVSILKAQRDSLELTNKQLQEAAKGFPGVNFEKAVTDFTSGQQSPDLQAVMSNPHSMQLFQAMVGWKKQEQSLNSQEARQDQRLSQQWDLAQQKEDRLSTKKYVDEGTQFFKKYGVGSPQTWAEYLSNPSIQSTVDDLVSGKVLAGKDPHLQALKAIGMRLQQDTNMHDDTQIRQNLLGVDKLIKEVKAGKTDKAIGLKAATDLLNQNAQIRGTGQVILTTGDNVPGVGKLGGFFNRNKIVALDPNTGKTVDIGDDDLSKLDKFTSNTTTSQYTPQQINQAAQLVKSQPNPITMKQVIDKLKKEHPEVYNILKQRGDIPNVDTANSPTP